MLNLDTIKDIGDAFFLSLINMIPTIQGVYLQV